MNQDPNDGRVYPMKKFPQLINQILGFWVWFWTIIVALFWTMVDVIVPLSLPFKWQRKAIPAFRKMMTGKPRSYLRVSKNGLEYRLWPVEEIRCAWEDVNCLHKGRWFGDVLYLERAEITGFSEFSITLGRPQIHLSSLAGWPEGGLADDLRRYRPQVFENQ